MAIILRVVWARFDISEVSVGKKSIPGLLRQVKSDDVCFYFGMYNYESNINIHSEL